MTIEEMDRVTAYRMAVANTIGRILGANDFNNDPLTKSRIDKIISEFDESQKGVKIF